MKKLNALIVVMLFYVTDFAQTPQYSIPHTPDPLLGDRSSLPFDSPKNLWQSIYYSSNFPGMPAQGEITAVYVKVRNNVPVGRTLHGLSIKLAATSLDSIPSTMYLAYQLLPCTQVYYNSVYNFATAKAPGEWMKLDLPTPFAYEFGGTDRKNLIVELAQDSGTVIADDEVGTFAIQDNVAGVRTIHDNKAHTQGYYANSNFLLVIGFDVQQVPTAVGAVNNEKKITVFPNPAKEMLSIKNSLDKNYLITDMAGRVLQKGIVENEPLKVSQLNKGLYILQIDNQRVKFMKE